MGTYRVNTENDNSFTVIYTRYQDGRLVVSRRVDGKVFVTRVEARSFKLQCEIDALRHRISLKQEEQARLMVEAQEVIG